MKRTQIFGFAGFIALAPILVATALLWPRGGVLDGKKIALLISENVNDLEANYSIMRLEEVGAQVDVLGASVGPVKGVYGLLAVMTTIHLDSVSPEPYSALLFLDDTGTIAKDSSVTALVQRFNADHKLLCSMGEGSKILVEANLVKGVHVAATPNVHDLLRNAGATLVDAPVVLSGNIITSPSTEDLLWFVPAIIDRIRYGRSGKPTAQDDE